MGKICFYEMGQFANKGTRHELSTFSEEMPLLKNKQRY